MAAGLTRLTQRTGRHQFADLRFVVPEDAFEHVLIVLAEHGSSAADDGRGTRESRARTLYREFAEAGMIQRYEMAAMRELRIPVRIGAVLHLMGGNAKRLKAGFNHTAIECVGPGSYARIDGVAMLEPSSGERVARVAGKVFIFNCGAKAAPVVIAAADDRDPLVIASGWINAMGAKMASEFPTVR